MSNNTTNHRKIILYIATSLDGFIAKEDGNIDWLTKYENSGEDYGFQEMYDNIDTICIGAKTYRQIEEPYLGKEVYVFSNQKPTHTASNIHFVSSDIEEIMTTIKTNKDIWLVGGADLVNQFLNANLIDEYIITIVPIILGKGIPLFQRGIPEYNLELIHSKTYVSGLVQVHYIRHE